MRNHLFLPLVLACALLLSACSGNNGNKLDKLNGKWQCDVKATLALIEQKAPEEMETMRPLMEGILTVTTADFNVKGGKVTLAVAGMGETHGFTLESEKGDTVTLKLDDGTLFIVEVKSDDSILFHEGDDTDKQLFFSRVK